MPKIITNDTVNLLFFKLTAISILVISKLYSFRVLFDKIASVYFIREIYWYFSISVASPGNRHCASCIGTLSCPRAITVSMQPVSTSVARASASTMSRHTAQVDAAGDGKHARSTGKCRSCRKEEEEQQRHPGHSIVFTRWCQQNKNGGELTLGRIWHVLQLHHECTAKYTACTTNPQHLILAEDN